MLLPYFRSPRPAGMPALMLAALLVASACGGGNDATSSAAVPWSLEMHHPGSQATMTADASGVMHIAIERNEDPTPYNVQLNHRGYNLKAGEKYVLSFRAKAARPREISLGISMAHEPWTGLGYYRQRPIGTEWTANEETFTLATGDSNARIHFDLAADTAAVDIDAVSLRTESGTAITPVAAK